MTPLPSVHGATATSQAPHRPTLALRQYQPRIAALCRHLTPTVTSVPPNFYDGPGWLLLASDDPVLRTLGIALTGEKATVAVRSLENRLGTVAVNCAQPGLLLMFDNEAWSGLLLLNLHITGPDCSCVFHLRGSGHVVLQNVLLRAARQFLFWGAGSTVNGCSILEINGEDKAVIVGDDALMSNGITIRNHDMHALVDTQSYEAVNPPVATIIEQHVWIGQDALLLTCERVGYGTVLAARALVKGVIPPKVVAGGMPAKVLRTERSWGRASFAISPEEVALLRRLDNQSEPVASGLAASGITTALADADAIRASRLFDPDFYQSQLTRRNVKPGTDLVLHYMAQGEAEGLWPHRLFDPTYYTTHMGQVQSGSALMHYLREGWRLGLRTHPLFDTEYYYSHNPDVLAAGVNALEHFLYCGGLEGRRPHPLFHSWMYVHSVPELRDAREDPLSHYLRQGWREGRNPHPLFNNEYYLAANPDVAAAGLNPLIHFVLTGLVEGRAPNPLFSAEAFRTTGAEPRRLTSTDAIEAACRSETGFENEYSRLSTEIKRSRGRKQGTSQPTPSTDPRARVLAFYLPQFHAIPENDQNWGAGFTEWTSVRQAKPNFPGHDQPRQPGELGYYDLNDPKVMEQQAALAKAYGVHGFCHYWYWFKGRKPLEMPIKRMLDTRSPDFPFCFCWANENWTRKWDGTHETILGHAFSGEDDLAHARDLAHYMADPRYIRVSGAPLLLIYRADTLPELPDYLAQFRAALRLAGVERVHLALVESGASAWAGRDPRALGFDSAVEFPPHGGVGMQPPRPDMLNPSFSGKLFDYRETVLRYATAPLPSYPRWRTVMAAWDNTARYQNDPAIFMNATPGAYRAWLEGALRDVQETWPAEDRLVFINAWNEWGEGTVLEPDERWGRAYLEATRDALADAGELPPNIGSASVKAA